MADPTEPGSSITSNQTNCYLGHRSSVPVFILIYSLVFLVGLVFNIFTMWFHCCQARQHLSNSWRMYLKNLTASDLLLCLSLPFRITKYSSCSFNVHLLFCSFGASALYLNMYASILFMGYIAAYRYMRIFYPLRTHFLMSTRATHIISKTTWVFLLVLMTVYTILMLITYKRLDSAPKTCSDLSSQQTKLFYYFVQVCAVIIFLSVLVSLVFFYCSTSRRVLEAQKNQPTSCDSRKLVKSRRNILVLVSVFCICFVPYHLVHLPYVFLREHRVAWLHGLKDTSVFMSVLNICLDPLLYVFLCKDFRARLNLKQMFSTNNNTNTSNTEERLNESADRQQQQLTAGSLLNKEAADPCGQERQE
ncbi:P2Y purinoceptor 14-like [Kryptolebias marmoratus]|uniref:P2Y purinoceptor 14-like n=1 Tax=Kryptolebias marmoratus TaxID=37003 RepID=UPI0007F9253A|nr:P2Y purinoceptor 14-like [Kryptolebias marmoratus]